MSEENNNPKDPKNGKRDNELKTPPRSWLIWIAILGLVPLLMVFKSQTDTNAEPLKSHEFFEALREDRVAEMVVKVNPQTDLREITGQYRPSEAPEAQGLKLFKTEFDNNHLTEAEKKLLIGHKNLTYKSTNNFLLNFFYAILPVIFLALLIYFIFIRQIKMAGKGALSFGKSKARMLSKERNKTTFKDVAGVEEAKEEVQELVEFLRDPKKFQKLGGRIPKGILMIGAPGSGKTLLAKAIAGEADASFFSISGSDFVEMFVGVGASRVRDMFEQARKNTPCLIFIDEIDAVGRSRGVGLGGGNDEREQTLNALLVEMDGFDTQEGIIIIAATNRPDVLDPALLRPGRFDRQISVNLPDVRGRECILKVHAKKVKLDPTADLGIIARGTPGYSGAELANLLNEAALLAARTNKKAIGMIELEEARDKVRWGRERRSMAMTDEEKKYTAWHEAGHALVNVLVQHTHPLHKVTIIPRGQSLGATMSLPKDDVFNRRRKEMLAMIAVTMGGRIAEEIISDDISTGAAGDIHQATNLTRAMVCHWGMSDKLGMVQYGSDDEYFLGREMLRKKEYSELTAQQIDAEVKRIIDEAYQTAKEIIDNNRDKLEMIAKALLEYETLEGHQVQEIVETGSFTPRTPTPEPEGPSNKAPDDIPEGSKATPPKLDPGLGAAPATA